MVIHTAGHPAAPVAGASMSGQAIIEPPGAEGDVTVGTEVEPVDPGRDAGNVSGTGAGVDTGTDVELGVGSGAGSGVGSGAGSGAGTGVGSGADTGKVTVSMTAPDESSSWSAPRTS